MKRLRIIAILRDWQKGKAKSSDYPSTQIVPIDIPVWSDIEAQVYLEARVRAHQDPNPPPCTDSERWKRDDVWAVMKDGRKSAVKLHERAASAQFHAAELGMGHSVVHRPGEYHRCAEYCNVAHACPQMKSEVDF